MGEKLIQTSAVRLRVMDKLNGKAIYGDDVRVPGMTYAKGVCAGAPHARIESIQVSDCLEVPGVLGVFTAKDLPGKKGFGLFMDDEPIFPDEYIKNVHDVVAVVVAETEAAAVMGSEKVIVEYSKLPSVLSIEDALKGNMRINKEYADNLCADFQIEKGDISQGVEESDMIVDETYKTSLIEHAYLEPEVIIAIPLADGKLEIQGSMQHPFFIRQVVCETIGVALEDVVVVPNILGGSFGGKVEVCAAMAARASVAARKLGRPVKYLLSREESICQSHKRHSISFNVKLGAKATGELNFLKVDALMDAGAYVNESPIVAWKTVTCGAGPYKIPNVSYSNRAVLTNNVVTGAMRGFGTPQSIFALESAMNEMAQKLGISPLEFRRKNLLKQNDETATSHKLDFSVVSISNVLEKAAEALDFEKKYETYSKEQTGRYRYGVGIACSIRGVSFGADVADVGRARIRLNPDGTVAYFCPMMDMGQGSDTVLTQICAEALKLPIEKITYMLPETVESPDTGAAGASRGTFIGGNATLDCVRKLKQKIARNFYCYEDEVCFKEGNVEVGSNVLTFKQIYNRFVEKAETPDCFGEYSVRELKWDHAKNQGEAYISYTYSCQAAEVKVDVGTGKTELLNMSACHDSGTIINYTTASGQVSGGMVMGAGMALIEELAIDPKTGSIVSDNLDKYLLPTAMDICPQTIIFEENADDVGPFGAKGLGEPSMEPSAAAIIGAINMALGDAGVIRSLPANLETVFFAANPDKMEGQ